MTSEVWSVCVGGRREQQMERGRADDLLRRGAILVGGGA